MINKSYLIGVCGGSGSGKTTFVNQLEAKLGKENIALVLMDNYYKPISQQTKDENGIENYDLPSAIDSERFINDINKLLLGEKLELVEYNFNNTTIIPKKIIVEKRPIIIIEGVFIYHFDALNAFFDLKIFIDTQEHLRIKRRLMRDLVERNYPIKETLYYIEHHVAPGYKKYIEPYIETCDLIIPNHQNFEKSLDILVDFLKVKRQKM